MAESRGDERDTISPGPPVTPNGSLRRSQWTAPTVRGTDGAVDADRATSAGRQGRSRKRAVLAGAAVVVLVVGGVALAAADSTKSSGGPAPSGRSDVPTDALVPLNVSITPGSRLAATPGSSADEGGGHTSGSASAPASAPLLGQQAAAGPSKPAAVSTSGPPAASQRIFRLRGEQSNRCLDVPQSKTANGTQLDIWDCSGDPNQVWTQTASGQITVYSGDDLRCVDAAFGGTTQGTFAIIWPCSSASNQWSFNANGTVTDVRSGLCLDVTDNSAGNGSPVELWTCNGGANQVWSSF